MSTNKSTSEVAIGVDLGGSNVRAALVRQDGVILKSERSPLDRRDPESLLGKLMLLCQALGTGDGADGSVPLGVGLAAQIWVGSGDVAVAPNLGWRDVPFGRMLSERLGQRVRLVNDLNAIAAGEAACGAGEGSTDVVCVFLGTGLGMGAVCNGRLIEGADGLATELGHIKVASLQTGRLCGCGARGCLEAYTSGRHLPELLVEKGKSGKASKLLAEAGVKLDSINAGSIEAAAAAGDAAAVALWDDIGESLGRAVANAVVLFNPRVVVLGGGVLNSAKGLEERVVSCIRATLTSPYRERTSIRNSQLGDNAGVIGAALLALAG